MSSQKPKTMPEEGSFRDPSGFIFTKSGAVYRQINSSYFSEFEKFNRSGLYRRLVRDGLLIKHRFVSRSSRAIIIRPQQIPFISYPYAWSFDMFKDAALLTLKIQRLALEHGMVLKDASAFNVQFTGTRPVFIDTLSFAFYREGETWIAYRQFCQHFLAPLALMSYTDPALNRLLRIYIDGLPLEMATKLLPLRARFNLSLAAHIYLHAANQKRMADKKIDTRRYRMSKPQMTSLVTNLEQTVRSLGIGKAESEWEKYYTFTNYSPEALKAKHEIVAGYIKSVRPGSVLDLGANNGEFSREAVKTGAYCIACDSDPLAVNLCYRQNPDNPALLPVVADLTNPSPDLGWAHSERKSFSRRFRTDLVMALALIHHLAISNNLPLTAIAGYLSQLGPDLIIEFVPKTDSKVKLLLQNREDIFPNYHQAGFEKAFARFYRITDKTPIPGSRRIIYLMKRG